MNRKKLFKQAPLFIAGLLFLALPTYAFYSTSLNSQGGSTLSLKYEVNDVFIGELKHTIQIINTAHSRIAGGKLFVPIVNNLTARHCSILYNVNSTGGEPTFLKDDFGNLYAYWNNIVIEPEKAFTVELDYNLISFSVSYVINSSMVKNYDKNSAVYKRYTQPEKLIESDNSQIISTARSITGDEENPYKKVQKIFDFVTTHLRYERQEEERGAFWALKNGVGDCSEYSYLFVALCRAAGIPARIHAGFAFNNVGESMKDGHMWAEFYLENYGWVPVDATWGQFQIRDFLHFSSIQSIPEVIPYANYVFNSTVGQEPKDEQLVQLKTLSMSSLNNDNFAENLLSAVQKIRQTEFAISLGKTFGASLFFSSEMHEAAQKFFEGKIYVQNAVDSWEINPQIAHSNVVNALENVEEASNSVWLLIAKTFTIFISVPTAIMLISMIFLKRYQVKQEAV
ncbi:MAG: transglutaminase-like domain-containing protein [Candidatus Bathyarchaeales archaeon]